MKVPLLIQFTGAQSTGKTTLLKAYAERYPVKVIGEISRRLQSQNIITNIDVQADSQTQMFLNAELIYEYFNKLGQNKPGEVIIAERSPICCLAYARHLKEPSDYMLKYTEKFVKSCIHRADVYIETVYFPLTFKFVTDGVRNEKSRDSINAEILQVLKEFKIPYTSLIYDNIDDRVEHLHSRINYINKVYEEII